MVLDERGVKDSSLSEDFLTIKAEFDRKNNDLRDEVNKAINKALHNIREDKEKIEEEFNIRIKDARAAQKQREEDIREKILKVKQLTGSHWFYYVFQLMWK